MSSTTRTILTLIACAIGAIVGFYAGLFINLSIFGLEVDDVWFPLLSAGLAGLGCAVAALASVHQTRRGAASAVSVVLGLLLAAIIIAGDLDLEAFIVGAGLMVIATTVMGWLGTGSS